MCNALSGLFVIDSDSEFCIDTPNPEARHNTTQLAGMEHNQASSDSAFLNGGYTNGSLLIIPITL